MARGGPAAILVALPHRAGAALFGRHERRRRLAGTDRDLLQGAARGDRAWILQKRVVVVVVRGFVAVLDQKPVVALALPIALVALAEAVRPHAHQRPAARQAFAFQPELQGAVLQAGMRVCLGDPIAAIPQLDRAAAILSFGDRAFEIPIIKGMVLNLDRQALVVRVKRGPLGDRPRFENTIELEPEVIVQARGIVALDDEAELARLRNRGGTRGLLGAVEIPLGAIGRKAVTTHVARSTGPPPGRFLTRLGQ